MQQWKLRNCIISEIKNKLQFVTFVDFLFEKTESLETNFLKQDEGSIKIKKGVILFCNDFCKAITEMNKGVEKLYFLSVSWKTAPSGY
jgi:hypothetical protein